MFRKLFILVLSLFILSCGDGLTYEQKINDYNLYISKADSLIQINNYEEAIKYANTAIAITDTLSVGFIKKGEACYALDWLDFAEENFDEAIEIEGKSSKVYKLRALVHLKNNDSDFLDDINVYIERHPDDDEALELRRDYYEQENKLDEAVEEYSNAITKDSDNVDLYIKRSELYFQNGNYEDALKDYNTILAFVPDNKPVEIKKTNLESLMSDNQNRNVFLILLIGIYILYLPLSFYVFKPLAARKAQNQIGGNFTMLKDPLVWALPIFLSIVFLTLYITDSVPNFK
ncbi:tetratricopeptide repeat protein [Subsaximicrobium wynnwilliamsii]|uniref:Tetratricopeptide repeat protein n=1 Tax=Subsaximicrobium wynnwilliamsii TaxID=291179 RepID=A0A5C6ZCM3_9FLAO|nr:tetratricopeptide repeat protein [Subsaximicrobium wynnwilliamsii]TXD81866.1 tetratricopeptide repeat protein [Subsaximicrobium wynnwilliamsii]TXD87535.1 tetratricopeptide repeat protein [Subsaximicrobium wynnwilliamsii]TXE01218.1 tetratricopeptide repeat protein [Subsaximicrobium wynnwilliamsii]